MRMKRTAAFFGKDAPALCCFCAICEICAICVPSTLLVLGCPPRERRQPCERSKCRSLATLGMTSISIPAAALARRGSVARQRRHTRIAALLAGGPLERVPRDQIHQARRPIHDRLVRRVVADIVVIHDEAR